MSKKSFYFHGEVNVYLQGLNALKVNYQTPGYLSYYLGSQRSNIKIRDFRCKANLAANNAIQGTRTKEFAEIFSQPARAKVQVSQGKININMYDSQKDADCPILWMGVVNNGESLPLAFVKWEVLKPLGKKQNCFAALVVDR